MFKIKLKKEQNKLKPSLTNCKQSVGNKFRVSRYKICSLIEQPSLQVCSIKLQKTFNFSSLQPPFFHFKKSLRSIKFQRAAKSSPCFKKLIFLQWLQKPLLSFQWSINSLGSKGPSLKSTKLSMDVPFEKKRFCIFFTCSFFSFAKKSLQGLLRAAFFKQGAFLNQALEDSEAKNTKVGCETKKRFADLCRRKSFLIPSSRELIKAQGNIGSFNYMQFLPRSTKKSSFEWPNRKSDSINSLFKTTNSSLLLSDFVDIQRKSFFELLEKGLIEEFSKRNPITNKNLEIFFYPEYYQLLPPEYNPRRSILYSKSYSAKLYVPAQLTDKKLQKSQLKWVLIGNLPLMTKRGHFILNGAPRVIVNQILRSPGIYFQGSLKEIFSEKWSEKPDITYKRFYTDLICLRGTWLRIEIDKNKEIWAQMKSKPTKIPILWFLLAMGLTERIIFKSVINPSRLLANFNTDINRKIIYRYVTNPSDAWKEISNLISPATQAHSKDIDLFDDGSQLKKKNVFFSFSSKKNESKAKLAKAGLIEVRNQELSPSYPPPFLIKNQKGVEGGKNQNQNQKGGCFAAKRAFRKHRLFLSSDFSNQIILYNIFKSRKKKLGSKHANLKRQTLKKIALKKSVLNKERKLEKLNDASFPASSFSDLAINKEDSELEKRHARAQDLSLKKNKNMKGLISFLTSSEKSKEGRNWIFKKFMNPRTYDLGKQGRLNFNRKLGLALSSYQTTLTAQDVLSATDYLLKLEKGLKKIDDIDHLKNRRVRTAGELLQIQIGIGLIRLEKMIREKLAFKIKIDSQIINAKKAVSAILTPPLFKQVKQAPRPENVSQQRRGLTVKKLLQLGYRKNDYFRQPFRLAIEDGASSIGKSIRRPSLIKFKIKKGEAFLTQKDASSPAEKKGNNIFKTILRLNKKLKNKGAANQLFCDQRIRWRQIKQWPPLDSHLFLTFLKSANVTHQNQKVSHYGATFEFKKAKQRLTDKKSFFRNEKSYYFGQPFRRFAKSSKKSFTSFIKCTHGGLDGHLTPQRLRLKSEGGSFLNSEATLALNPRSLLGWTEKGWTEKSWTEKGWTEKQKIADDKKPVLNNMLSFFNTKPFNGALREFFGSCLTPDHNVLTDKGFIPIQKVTLEHKVATLKNNKELVYVHPIKVHKYDHDGQVYEVDVPGVSLKTTLNHRMYVQLHTDKQVQPHPYVLIPASDLLNKKVCYKKDAFWTKSDYQFILPGIPSLSPKENIHWLRSLCNSAPFSNSKANLKFPSMRNFQKAIPSLIEKIMPMDAWLVFMGFFISAGWAVNYDLKNPNSSEDVEYKVVFSQKKTIQWTQIEKNLTELNIEYYKIPDATGYFNYCIFDKQLWAYLRPYSKGVLNKTLPEWVWKLSKRQCNILLDALIAGNETTSSVFKSSRRYCSSSLKLINDVSRLILHAGYAPFSNLSEKRDRPKNRTSNNKVLLSTNPTWSVNVLSNRLSPFVNTFSDSASIHFLPSDRVQIRRPYHPIIGLGHSGSSIRSKDPFFIFKRNPQLTFKPLPSLLTPVASSYPHPPSDSDSDSDSYPPFLNLKKGAASLHRKEGGNNQKEGRLFKLEAESAAFFKQDAIEDREAKKTKQTLSEGSKPFQNGFFWKVRIAKALFKWGVLRPYKLRQPFKVKVKIAPYGDRHTKYGTMRTLLASLRRKEGGNNQKERPLFKFASQRRFLNYFKKDKLVYYKGPVYCLTVPNEVFYVERNGKGVWTGNSQLSQFMDQLNPLAEITHKRRLSSMGPGGVTRDSATLAIRGIHPTHYGRICPIETPEGKNTGLVNSLTTYARANSQGFLESPFFKVYKGQIQKNAGIYYLSAEQEENIKVAAADVSSLSGRIGFLPKSKIPAKIVYGDTITKISRNLVQYIGVSPIQMISIATSLIPFLEHDDANRALMGSNMQRQAVPLIRAERPLVGTGLESRTVSDSGHSVIAKESGYVAYVSAKKIVIYTGGLF